ncbi:MAG: YebC/PmpR family DNA-binding transcriptional regulator [Candidatus Nealsonbacteria bacterium]|nr:YebC/PmpR family DNA-binding transcriptional regulator [Candidatus Nealsonbacteria bacterium]
MSGHSHWHSIKYKKGAADAKKGKVFSKISKEITIAAKEGGKDISFNPKLRMAVEKARSFNMPAENIERAIKKGTGEIEGEKLVSVAFEAYGPGGIAVIIEGITDNTNRTLGEIKQILSQYNGKMVGEGGVKWMFDKKGVIEAAFENEEEAELTAIEAGAEDVNFQDGVLSIYTKPEELEKVKTKLETKGIKIEGTSLDWVAKESIKVSEREEATCQKLFEALDENEAVQEIYYNF